ncbi:MAG: epoxyqueuosine reductase [Deltaproteobacteria bacterium]|nr:epoxyqueuosine reductase [Deltaproteobacteria bacterium]
MEKSQQLSELVKDIARGSEAVAVGIATTETLEGGPPSIDLTYVLPEARSAIVFALPLDQDAIERFLKKEDMASANIDNRRVNIMASGIALTLSDFLVMKGYKSVPMTANAVYRKDTPRGPFDEKPPISHRYLAVRSGLGHFGLSGNVIMKKYGAAIIFASVVTEAELIPTEPLPPEDSYCDQCRLCMSACASGLMSPDEETTVTLGGVDFSYAKRRSHNRCDYVCGGFTGLHQSGKWSTWSPARFPIPENDDEFLGALLKAAKPYVNRPKTNYGIYHPLIPGDLLEFTCAHCQFICHPDKEVRQDRFKMLTNSGVVVQNEDGSLEAVSPEEAKTRLAAMNPKRRALYEE